MLQYLQLLGKWLFEAVFLTPVSGIIVIFLQGEKSLESDVVSPSSKMVIVVRVVFTFCKWRSFLFAQIAVISSWKKML